MLANSTIWKVNRDEAVACKNCGVGKFNNLEGQSDEAVACKDCGVGKFNDQMHKLRCRQINNLERQSDEATIWKVACKNCGVGKFNDLEGQSDEAVACKICDIGTFNNVVGAAACVACPLNTLHNASSVCCTQPGTYQTSDQCFACPQPQYCQVAQYASVIVKAWPA